MDFHVILSIVLGLLEVVGIGFAIHHVLSERKKQKRNPGTLHTYRPTLPIIILTLFVLAGITFLALTFRNPRPFAVITTYWSLIQTGILLTLAVSLISIVLGTALGILGALLIARRKGILFSTLVESPIMSVIYILLGIPALVLLYITYYTGVQSIFWAAVLALSINLSPFVAKIVSSSIRDISQEQINSAIAFGYTPRQITAFFKIGFVIRHSLQPLLVEYYTTIKLSSFAGLIGLTEIYHASQEIIKETQDPVTSYIVLATAYVFIVTPFAILADYIEHKWKKVIG